MSDYPYLRLNLGSDRTDKHLTIFQLVQLIRTQILSYAGSKGLRLPPVRVLAHQIGVSKNTIQQVYEELKAQGLVESKARQGLFITLSTEDQSPQNGVLAVQKVSPTPIKLKKREDVSSEMDQTSAKRPLYLSSVMIDPSLFPTQQLSLCMRSVLKLPGLTHQTYIQGFPPLRQKIAERLKKRGIHVSADQIIITNGSQQGLDLVARTLLTPKVATENPAYSLGKQLLESYGLKLCGLPIDPFRGIDFQLWEKTLKEFRPSLVYLTSNFQNPNGYSYTSKELSSIIEWSSQFGFALLEDDWGAEILSYSEFRPGLKTIGGEEVLYLNTFTKKLLPSLRIGYLVAPKWAIPTLLSAKKMSTASVSSILEMTLFEFLDRGLYDSYLTKLQHELDQRYQHCLTLLRTYMPEGVKWTTPGGGTTLWLELPSSLLLEKLIQKLKEKNIWVDLNDDSFLGTPHLHGIKIGHAFLKPTEMERAITELATIVSIERD